MPDFLVNIIKSPWFIGAVLVAYGAYYLFTKVIPGAKNVKLALSNYRMDKSSTLSPDQLRLVALSGISAEQMSAYHNTLSLGKDIKSRAQSILSEGYGVDTPRTAREAIESRLSGQFSSLLPIVFGAVQLPGDKRKDFLHEAAGDNRDLYNFLMDMVDNLSKSLPVLKKESIISEEADIMKYGFIGWEIGQASILVRAAYDVAYITEEEAWKYLEQAQGLAKKTLKSWNDLGMSYLVGRAAQMGGTDDMEAIVFGMLKDKNSPWLSIEW